MSLSEPIMSVLCEFESAFSQPTWSKIQVLITNRVIILYSLVGSLADRIGSS